MQIHQLEVQRIYETVLDQKTGRLVRKPSESLQPAGTTAITFEDQEYRAQPDGTFDVPHDVGAFYLTQDGWLPGPNPFAEQILAASDAAVKAAAEERAAEEERAEPDEEAKRVAAAKAKPAK